jgi:hypothetical protein
MKPLILLMCSAMFALATDDIRIVAGVTVNLAPIHEWEAEKKGERPLPHWKRVQVVSLWNNVAGYDRCSVSVGRESKVVLLANLAPQLKQAFAETDKLAKEVKVLSDKIKVAERQVREADAVTPIGAAGSPAYVQERMSRRYEVNLASERLSQEKERLDELNSRYLLALRLREAQASVLAMFTGRKHGGMEIWDCGRKQ